MYHSNFKQMKTHILISILLASFLFATSCKKEEPSNPAETSNQPTTTTSLVGFGDRGGIPSGYPFSLPYNVKVTTPMEGWDTAFASYKWCGIGTIDAFFTLTNFNNISTIVNFPAGLTFLPDSDSLQTGLTIHPVIITLPANGSEKISLRFYCINHNKAQATNGHFYKMGVISNNEQVATLLNAAKAKSDSILFSHNWELQDIVWDISDRSGLTQTDLDKIASW
jgi:hypothetical protein